MEETKNIRSVSHNNYSRRMSEMTDYLRGKHIQRVNRKCPLLAAGGRDRRIDIFSNSLEHIFSLYGHKGEIRCLATQEESRILASGSEDKSIKWDSYKYIYIYINLFAY